MFQEGILGREFGRKANRTYLTNLVTFPGISPICERIAAGFHNQNRLRSSPTSLSSAVTLEVDDYDESKHENKFQKIKAEPSDPATSLTIEY